jgi:hypothetical protein
MAKMKEKEQEEANLNRDKTERIETRGMNSMLLLFGDNKVKVFKPLEAIDIVCALRSEIKFFYFYFYFILFFFSFFFYYSYVHTRLGLFLPPAPTPSLTTHSTPSRSPLNTQQKLFCPYL